MLQLVLEKGADVMSQDSRGMTALHLTMLNYRMGAYYPGTGRKRTGGDFSKNPMALKALQDRGETIIKILIARGADVSVRSNDLKTPLHLAVILSNLEGNNRLAEILLEHGADVNAVDGIGSTPLHYAESRDIARILLSSGADVNKLNSDDETPLHTAAGWGRLEVTAILLECGADPTACNYNGMTADQVAGIYRKKKLAHQRFCRVELEMKVGKDAVWCRRRSIE